MMDQLLSELKEVVLRDLAKDKSMDSSSEVQKQAKKGHKTGIEDATLDKPLVLKINLRYIVSAVIIKDGKVLMMKEAKKSCRGLWYLPAGKVEKNESLVEGVKREVLEETGIRFEPTSLICIDKSRTLSWQRFTFTGNITGGKVKTVQEADEESIEAAWFKPLEIFSRSIPLRAPDIIPHIKIALKWKEVKEKDSSLISLPVLLPHKRMKIQVVLVSHDDNDGLKILLDKENCSGFLHCTPSTLCCAIPEVLHLILMRALKVNKADYQLHGILAVEHAGKPHGAADGLCITLLAEIPTLLNPSNPTRYMWMEVADERLRSRIRLLLEKGCIEMV